MLEHAPKAPQIRGLFINGQWRDTPNHFDDLNPSDGSVWASIPDAGAKETGDAINAAQAALAGTPLQGTWATTASC